MEPAAQASSAPARPTSDVSVAVGWVGLGALVGMLLLCRYWAQVAQALDLGGPRAPMLGPYAAVAAMLVCGAAMALWSVVVDKVHRRPSAGFDWHGRRSWREAWGFSWVKLLGLWATWGAIALVYGIFRFYWQGQWGFAMALLGWAIWPLAALSLPYVWWLDRVLIEPRDGAWHCGAWLLGRAEAEPDALLRHVRRWAVKGFFTAFMLSILPGGFAFVVGFDFSAIGRDPVALANWAIGLLFLIDVQIGTVGYLLTLRPLDAHIRSANPYLDGWLAALVCYPPFVLMGGGGVLDYHQGAAEWSVWLAGYPALLWAWGALLVGLTGVYAWATMVFGLRFSNLTYRGIITHGPYALTRHPAYLAKNCFWWLAGLPFLVQGGSVAEALRNCAILAMVSGVYYWRAKTEERHLLAHDAKYRAYHAWAQIHAPVTQALAWATRKIFG